MYKKTKYLIAWFMSCGLATAVAQPNLSSISHRLISETSEWAFSTREQGGAPS